MTLRLTLLKSQRKSDVFGQWEFSLKPTMDCSRYTHVILATIVLTCAFLTPSIETVPADRFMPPSWTQMCQAEVSPLKPKSFTSHTVFDVRMSPFGSSGGLGNPFLKPGQEFRNKIQSLSDNSGNGFMGTTIQPAKRDSSLNNQPLSTPTPTPRASTTRTKMNDITCTISKSDAVHWRLMDLHSWQSDNNINAMTTPSNRTVVFSLRIDCEPGANISLPWPMKSRGLLEVHVRNCGLVDQFSLAGHPLVSQIPDELQVLDIRDSFWLVDLNSENSILENTVTDFINIDSDYDCGQDASLKVYISRNVTFASHDSFNKIGLNSSDDQIIENGTVSGKLSSPEHTTKRPIRPEDRLITNKEALISDHHTHQMEKIPNFGDVLFNRNDTDDILTNLTAKQDFFELLKKIKNTRIQCDFVKLLVRDESLSSDTPRHLLQVSTQEATHPVLQVLNYSSVGMTEFPRELSQWRLYFPRLMYLDLSHNHISNLKVENYPVMPDTPRTIVNIRHNKMTIITPEILQSWASVDKFHVDFTHNPISCDCNLKSMVPFLKNESAFTGKMKQYEYVKYMRCSSPTKLQGRRLKSLNVDDLPCPIFESSNDSIIALAVLLATFVVLTIVLIRFKFEIRILLYTRLHVRLPCDSDASRSSKHYDAFVSYSNDDSDWVLQNLVSYLEKDIISTNGNNVPYGIDENSNSSAWNDSRSRSSSSRNRSTRTPQTIGKIDRGNFKLCLHQRDFIPGKTIVDNIVDSIEASRHTIIVLSPSFMMSHWAMEELRQAYRQSLVDKTRHLIVVLLEKVPDEAMDPLIRRCVKTFTYLEVQDSIFRDKLVFSLSTKDRASRNRDRLASKQSVHSTNKGRTSNGSKSNIGTAAHENFTYIHDLPSSPPPPPTTTSSLEHNNCYSRNPNQRVTNEYETIPFHSSSNSSSQFPLPLPTQNTDATTIVIRNGNEMFQQQQERKEEEKQHIRPTYYTFPSQNHGDVTTRSPRSGDVNGSDGCYYSSVDTMPNTNSSSTSSRLGDGKQHEYEIPIDLMKKDAGDGLRPDAPARILSNSSTSSTTALTWNL